jgi:protein TonB
LAEKKLGLVERIGRGSVLAAFAVVAHVGVAIFLLGAAKLAKMAWLAEDHDVIEVAMVEPTAKPPPIEKQIEKPPAPTVTKKKTRPPPPPPDPIDHRSPPQPEKPSPPVVGLEKASTSSDGDGPAFAVGNTRMGTTETTAKDPNAVHELSKAPAPTPVVVPPRRQRMVEPDYPAAYRDLGFEGEVILKVTIDVKGSPVSVEIVRPSPHAEFNRAAREAALSERFSPAMRDGQPIEFALTRKYTFKLTD